MEWSRVFLAVAYLDEILSFGLGDEWLEFGSGEGVDETCFRDDQQQDLGAGENREFIGLTRHDHIYVSMLH